jgi:hypothetical protein
VEVVTLSTVLNPGEAEKRLVQIEGGAFLGIRVATMASDGNLYLVEHPVARLSINKEGRILSAAPAIDKTLAGFSDEKKVPPGVAITNKKQTPFVWAEEHYR